MHLVIRSLPVRAIAYSFALMDNSQLLIFLCFGRYLLGIYILKGESVMAQNEPPLTLVRTWYELLLQSDNESASAHAQTMLLGAFGSPEAVAIYLKKHKIID